MPKKQAEVGSRRVLVRAYKSTFVITIPKKAKVTIGPDLPYGATRNRFNPTLESSGPRTYAFRAYDGTKLLIYLPRVEWMRDLDDTQLSRLELHNNWKEPDKASCEALVHTAIKGISLQVGPASSSIAMALPALMSDPGDLLEEPAEEMV